MRVKRVMAIVLVFASLLILLAGCLPEGENDVKLVLQTPKAMASFGNSPITGVKTEEPAGLTVSGKSEVKDVSVLVGDNDSTYTVRTLSGYGSEMTFTLEGVTPNAPAMIDIEEIHLRTDGAISYAVYVNGTEVYGRTYAPIADGPNHAFFDISAEVVGSSGALTVRLVNLTENEVRFRRVWAVSDPEKTAEEQGISKKMDVVLMLNETPSNLNYEYLVSLVESYRCDGMYNVGLCWEINHLAWGKEKTEKYLNNVIMASIQTGAPLYLGINSWWGGTSYGVDGEGGMWQDVQYQQITYDANNADGRGLWKLTTPNEFSDTPWLSMNNDTYNAARVKRIKETVEYLQLRTAELALSGQELPAIHLYTENEPYYWPINWTKYDFNNYPRGVGDFSPLVIADAASDGVTLDPTDGLSSEEAFWLYRNLHTYISEVGRAMSDGLGYNYITVKDGVVTYPTEQMVSDSYSHTPIHAIYPNWEENRRAWENHVLDSIHFGGEWSTWLDSDASRSLDYLLAYGSFSNINAERAGFPGGFESTDFRVLSQCYAYGLEGVVIYNVLANSDQQNVIEESILGDALMEVRNYDVDPLYESDFSQRTAYSVTHTLIAITGLRWDGAAVVPNSEQGGSLTYRIRNASAYTTGLRVGISGSFSDSNGRIEVLAGTNAENLQSVGIYDSVQQNVQIDPSLYAGSDEVYICVRIYGENMTTAQLAGLSVTKVGIYRAGGNTGCTDGSVYTYDENRIRCQIVAARADVERLLNSYIERCGGSITTETQKKHFENAYDLYAEGRYGEAFAAISQSISQLLPATFTVSGYGQLGEYPVEISVDSSAKVTVTLKEVSDEAVRFSMSASSDAAVTVTLQTKSGKWSLTQQEDGNWLLAKGGDTAAKDGKVSFTVDLAERVSMDYPDEFEARVVSITDTTLSAQSQDLRVTDYSNFTDFSFARNVQVYRGPDGTAKEDLAPCDKSELQYSDYVVVKLNENGLICEIYAWYGIITGKVIAVEEMSVTGTLSNAFVTVQASDGTTKRLEIGWECTLSFTGATGAMGKLALVESVGLKEGQQITVRYCPYETNGRIRAFEITD